MKKSFYGKDPQTLAARFSAVKLGWGMNAAAKINSDQAAQHLVSKIVQFENKHGPILTIKALGASLEASAKQNKCLPLAKDSVVRGPLLHELERLIETSPLKKGYDAKYLGEGLVHLKCAFGKCGFYFYDTLESKMSDKQNQVIEIIRDNPHVVEIDGPVTQSHVNKALRKYNLLSKKICKINSECFKSPKDSGTSQVLVYNNQGSVLIRTKPDGSGFLNKVKRGFQKLES